MYSRLFFFLTLLLLNLPSHSQDSSALKKFEQRTIFQFNNRYWINEKPLKFKELKVELNKFNDASAEYHSFRKISKVSTLLSLGALIMEGTAIAISKNNKGLSNGLFIASGASLLISLPIAISARYHLQKAVWRYNKNVMAY